MILNCGAACSVQDVREDMQAVHHLLIHQRRVRWVLESAWKTSMQFCSNNVGK